LFFFFREGSIADRRTSEDSSWEMLTMIRQGMRVIQPDSVVRNG
jgi:hypothetical protein